MPKAPSKSLRVDGKDLDDLRKSGLTDGTIIANDLYTSTDPQEIAGFLRQNPNLPSCRGGGLVFRYLDLDGHRNGYAQVKPHWPRNNRDGKPIKYESPRASHSRLTSPPQVCP